VLDRAVRGSILCDGRLIHELEALPQGARLDVHCREFLELEADDGGALLIGLEGAEPVRAGTDGVPLVRYRIEASSRKRDSAGGTP
jgi:hypothetical protein